MLIEAGCLCNPFGICLFLMIMLATTLNTLGSLFTYTIKWPGINASSRPLIKNRVFIVYRCASRCISQVLRIGVNSSETEIKRLCAVLQCECVSHPVCVPQVCVCPAAKLCFGEHQYDWHSGEPWKKDRREDQPRYSHRRPARLVWLLCMNVKL